MELGTETWNDETNTRFGISDINNHKIASEQPEKLRTMVKGEIWCQIVDPDPRSRNWNMEY